MAAHQGSASCPQAAELAALLEGLKQRSGTSYTALAARTGMARSTLHRYCRGTTVPSSFAAIERLARVCAVDSEELDGLYRAWTRARDAQAAKVEGEVAPPAADNPAEPPGASPSGGPSADAAADPAAAPPAGASAEPPSEPSPKDAADTPSHVPADGEGVRDTPNRPTPPIRPTSSPPSPRVSRPRRGPLRAPSRSGPPSRALRLMAAGVVMAMLAIGSAASSGDGAAEGSGAAAEGAPQVTKGPEWTVAPREVPSDFYGMTMNTDTGAMPDFTTGSIRMWDSYTTWPLIEPRRGEFEWSVVDRTVRGAERAGLPVLFTIGGVPHWANPEGRRVSYHSRTVAGPPRSLRDWDNFVRELSSRYKGRIEAYELWDYPNFSKSFNGTPEQLATMVKRASRVLARTDPEARVVCPSIGELWKAEGRSYLARFAAAGAYAHCDVAAFKLHPRSADGPPEEIVELVRKTVRVLRQHEVIEIPIWNTGPGYDIVRTPPLDARRARDYAVRFFLAGMYTNYFNVERMYFYSWGSRQVPLVVQPVGGAPTEAGRRIGRLQRMLADARIESCGKGTDMGLPRHAYECRFRRSGGELTVVRWMSRGGTEIRLEPGAERLRRLDGSERSVRPGEPVPIREEPVLIDHGSR